VTHKAEAFAVEHEIAGEQAAVADNDPARIELAAAHVRRSAGARRGDDLLAGVDEIIERRLDRRERFGLPFEHLIHDQLLRHARPCRICKIDRASWPGKSRELAPSSMPPCVRDTRTGGSHPE